MARTTWPPEKLAARLRGFGPVGLLAFVIILLPAPTWIRALLVLFWAWLSRTSWRAIGLVRPANWGRTLLFGFALGATLKLVMKAIVMPLLGAPDRNAAYQFLVGNSAVLPMILAFVIVSGGIAEEIVFRGYLFERLGKLLGQSRPAIIAIIVATSAYFAALHYPDQRLPGVQQAFVTGMTFGAIFAATRQLPFVMAVHAAFDIVAVLIIYFDVEAQAAHLLFK